MCRPFDREGKLVYEEAAMAVAFKSIELLYDIVAPVIYGSYPHRVTNRVAGIVPEVCEELRMFLRDFTLYNRIAVQRGRLYYRIDAYFDFKRLWILEVNTAFVDGWGTAFNLARAANIRVPRENLRFPRQFATIDPVYLPELKLFADELAYLGVPRPDICEWQGGAHMQEQIYVYGRQDTRCANILPYAGTFLDRKDRLMCFSHDRWRGRYVHVPRHYSLDLCTWDSVPDDVVLKFVVKDGVEAQQARHSVIMGKPSGKAKFLRHCYAEGRLIAQERILPGKDRVQEGNCQLVILAIEGDPITGYTQFGPKDIINDDSVHGPLELWCDPATY